MKGKIVLDLGTPWSFRKELKNYENDFAGVYYFSMGYKISDRKDPYSPHIDGDICKLPFKTESVDGIICKEVLEHVYNPFLAIDEMFRVLKKGGKIFCTLPFIYPYHGSGHEKDFWRFSQDGIDYLFSQFRMVKITPSGGYIYILKNFLPVQINRFLYPPFSVLINIFDKLIVRKNNTSIWMVSAVK